MKILCLSASNMVNKQGAESTSYRVCGIVLQEMSRRIKLVEQGIIELKKYTIAPCIGCGECYHTRRCIANDDFNDVYEQLITSDIIVIVSPHYAPIPAKLAALLEKMEQITFLHWAKDNSYQSEVDGILAGIISHGGGGLGALPCYKAMVNDTIANALDTIQLKLIPFNKEWNTGIALPVEKSVNTDVSKFPVQEYNWEILQNSIAQYASKIANVACEVYEMK